MRNFVHDDERKYENTMPIGEAPPELLPKRKKRVGLTKKKKRGIMRWSSARKKYSKILIQ